jgi:hypothetical protein
MNTSNVSTQSPDRTYVYLTGSRRLDLLCWCVLVLLLLAISPSFRVYYKVAAILAPVLALVDSRRGDRLSLHPQRDRPDWDAGLDVHVFVPLFLTACD